MSNRLLETSRWRVEIGVETCQLSTLARRLHLSGAEVKVEPPPGPTRSRELVGPSCLEGFRREPVDLARPKWHVDLWLRRVRVYECQAASVCSCP